MCGGFGFASGGAEHVNRCDRHPRDRFWKVCWRARAWLSRGRGLVVITSASEGGRGRQKKKPRKGTRGLRMLCAWSSCEEEPRKKPIRIVGRWLSTCQRFRGKPRAGSSPAARPLS